MTNQTSQTVPNQTAPTEQKALTLAEMLANSSPIENPLAKAKEMNEAPRFLNDGELVEVYSDSFRYLPNNPHVKKNGEKYTSNDYLFAVVGKDTTSKAYRLCNRSTYLVMMDRLKEATDQNKGKMPATFTYKRPYQ